MSSFRLFVADAVDLMRSLPDESVDLLVTDTAYESLEKHRAVGTTTRLKKSAGSSNEWFDLFRNDRFPEFFYESMRVLKKNAHLYFYCDEDTADVAKPIGRAAGFTFWKSIVWAKTRQGMTPDADDLTVDHQAMGMGYHYRSSKEFILFFEKGKRRLTDLGVRDVLPFPAIRNGHPTEKPVDLNKVFIRLSSEPGETVLDPFMGSASAGVAAIKLGRNFIGGDIKDTTVARAQERLKAAGGESLSDPAVIPVSERTTFVAPEAPPKKTRAKKSNKDVMPIAEMDGTDIELNASRSWKERVAVIEGIVGPLDAPDPPAPSPPPPGFTVEEWAVVEKHITDSTVVVDGEEVYRPKPQDDGTGDERVWTKEELEELV